MFDRNYAENRGLNDTNTIERDFWLNMLSGNPGKTTFPYDYRAPGTGERRIDSFKFELPGKICAELLKVSRGADHSLNAMLVAGVALLLGKYSGSSDLLLGTPVYKQHKKTGLLNTMLVLRNRIKEKMTFKELLVQVGQTIVEATKHYRYPIEMLLEDLDVTVSETDDFPLFDIVILLENIHDKRYIPSINLNMIFSFLRTNESIEGKIEYNSSLYDKLTVERIGGHFEKILDDALFDLEKQLSRIDILTEEEKNRLLYRFNGTETEYPRDKAIHELFEAQVEKTSDHVALVSEDKQLTYRVLNEKSNRLAHMLRAKGLKQDSIAGIMLERFIDMIIAVLGVLKAGGAYLPIDDEIPEKRMKYMLDDCEVQVLITTNTTISDFSFVSLQDLRVSRKTNLKRTAVRKQITELDTLPVPDRSMVNYEKYHKYIGLGLVKKSMSLQATRGCPYNCAYCHKIWPKTHFVRSAENIYEEVKAYNDMGIRRFSFIDDIFNFNIKNSSRFFELIIKNNLDVEFIYPSGIRADILTEEYIDLMIEAGTINFALALETASPRLQKLIGKNLNIEKLRRNAEYICKKHPQALMDVFTMHGFPTETKEEAKMTLDFLRSIHWIHFPSIAVLKIYPNTDMERVAINNGITREAIYQSENLAFHELPETLPFEKAFSQEYQSEFLSDIFLSKERLLNVLPYQMKALTEDEIVQKYNSYLPTQITSFVDLLKLADISIDELKVKECRSEETTAVYNLNEQLRVHFPSDQVDEDALRVLLLDLSQYFSEGCDMLYDVVEAPLGAMYLMTNLKHEFGTRINGKIAKSRFDFDNYAELKALLEEFKPEFIGVRTLSFHKNFLHRTVSMIRQWGIDVPIIAGGPYATSDYERILQDKNIDLVVIGEGEITFNEIIRKFLENGRQMPATEVLEKIAGIAFIPAEEKQDARLGREIIMMDELSRAPGENPAKNPGNINQPGNLAYTMFTSGSTGRPKAVMVEHQNVVRLINNTNFINFRQEDKLLQTAPLEFDASTFELWGPLLNGSCLYLTSKNQILTAERLKEAVRKYGISTMWMSSPLFNQMSDIDIEIFRGVKTLVVGGDALSPAHINSVRKQFPQLNVINGYGPTENTTFSLTHFVDTDYLTNIPIGKPIANSTAFILDKNMQLLPPGIIDGLYVGGDGVSRGYMNDPELTEAKFITNPFVENGRLYKTGDLTRWLPDGNMEFLGRSDNQVKVRGYRIELGEIEVQLSNHSKIKEAIAVVKETRDGDKQICAYVVSDSDIIKSELRDYLLDYLPEFMIPVHFIRLDSLPLNARGKIDKKQLLDPEVATGADHIAPRDDVEERLAGIWSEILEVKKEAVGINSNFFDLGGHSLKSTILVSRIHKEFNVKVPMSEIFRTPTVREVAEYIKGAKGDKFASIKPVSEKEYYELSSAQKRLFVLQQMETSVTNYNTPIVLILEGNLEKERIEETFKKLISMHESLRTRFYMIDEEPVQQICKEVDFALEYHTADENQAEDITKRFIRIFDLGQAPLLRGGIIKLAENKHLLMVDMHHIITDGTSLGIFVKEFMALYDGEELPPLRLQYKDFAEWQNNQIRSGEMKKQEDYWLTQFDGEIPVLQLPTDYTRPAVQSFEGSSISFNISSQNTRKLEDLAAKKEATMYMVLHAIFNVLMARISGSEDIIVGTVAAGRRHADLDQIIGMFVNTLAPRNYPAGEKTFEKFLEEVKQRTLAAFENQDYQFEALVDQVEVKRDMSRNPLFDVMFILQNMDLPEFEIPGLEMKQSATINKFDKTKFDMTLNGVETDDGLSFTWEYCTKLFKKETIERFIKYFKSIISTVVNEPGKKISDICLMSENEKKQVLYDFNSTERQFPAGKLIHEIFEEQVEMKPGNIALLHRDERLTYKQLNGCANRLAKILRQKGVKPDTIVAISAERSFQMIVAILGILKAGGAYLPLTSEYPEERVNYILKDSNVKLLLSDEPVPEAIKGICQTIDLRQFDLYNSSDAYLKRHNTPRNLAYVMYTSGSTGEPKGVQIEQRSALNILMGLQERYPFEETDVYLLKTSFVFDVSVTELFGWFLAGGRLSILEKTGERVPAMILDTIEKEQVTHINFVPSMFSAFMEYLTRKNTDRISCLKYIFLAGEAVLPEMINRFKTLSLNCRLENIYGPTEATIYGSWYSLADWDGASYIPIGKPVINARLYILDAYDNLQPIGIWGELHIGGAGLARGYLNKPGHTLEKFIVNPLDHSERLYRTGDIARWREDGNIEFAGRKDSQVKVRGFRIETGEIESQLARHRDIKEAVVVPRDDRKDKYLCAYIVPTSRGTDTLDVPQLREYLLKKLPNYMIPSSFVFMETLPLTAGGKIDRLSLPKPEIAGELYIAPENETERMLAEIWQDVLGAERIGIDDNFFKLGGDSIQIIQIAARLKKYGFEVKVNDLFSNPTIRQLKQYVKTVKREIDQGTVGGEVELTPIQKWFFGNDFTGKHHFNQAVMIYKPGGFQVNRVEQVFTKIIQHHDALRMVFEIKQDSIVQRNRDIEGKLFDIEVIDLKNKDHIEEKIAAEASRIQGGIDLNTGPLVKLGLFRTGDGDHLMVAIHHLVIDGISWRILLEDFEIGYNQLERGEGIAFQAKTDSFKYWSQRLSEYAGTKDALKEREFWNKVETADIEPLPKDHRLDADQQKKKFTAVVTMNLDEEETALLLKKVNRAYNTEINDILLTAVGMAVNDWTQQQNVLINLEGHGREGIIEDIDISRTVGWFTTQYPILLDVSRSEDIAYTVKSVKETLRRIPNKGIGFGILKYLAQEMEAGNPVIEPEISFNYLGQYDGGRSSEFIQMSGLNSGDVISPESEWKRVLDINGMLVDNRLTMGFTYNKYQYEAASIQGLAERFKSNLIEVIRHCSQQEKSELTPSDLGCYSISPDDFTRAVKDIKQHIGKDSEIQLAYPLTPMQSGMFYHSLKSKDSTAYFEQYEIKIEGEINRSLLKQSFDILFDRYDILRTIFVYENLSEPVQMVLKDREIQIKYEDITHLTESEKSLYLDRFKQEERENGFDLTRDPLMRTSLFKTGPGSNLLVWAFHHILMDGWCIGIIFNDLVRVYHSIKHGKSLELEPTPPYRNYIMWLERQDKEEGLRYWTEYLEGYHRQAALPKLPENRIADDKYELKVYQHYLSEELTEGLKEIGKEKQVTLGVVIQTIWGILLQKYNNCNDVVFGTVVSGRPPEVEGIENMVGLFINAVPVRIKTEENQNFSELLLDVQHKSKQSKSYEYSPLAEIQSKTVLKMKLINHMVGYENYPIIGENLDEYIEKELGFSIKGITGQTQSNYDFNLGIMPGKRFEMRFIFDDSVYNPEITEKIAIHYQDVIKQVLENSNIQLKNIKISHDFLLAKANTPASLEDEWV